MTESFQQSWTCTALEMARAIRERRVRSTDLVRESLARIEALDSSLKAFLTVNADAERDAELIDQKTAAGERLGLLHGVPVAVKDVAATKGLRTTFGCARFANHIPDHDDLCVERLRRAGAVIVGKTNTPEFGFGAVCGNRLFGPTCNPYDLERTSGGSSGGSAAAVAAGLVPIAHGTDFGGSVRTPASFCGIVGFRPTPGLIPEPAFPTAWNQLCTHGVLARTVEDAVLMFDAMTEPETGFHRARPGRPFSGLNTEDKELRTQRVGFAQGGSDSFPVDVEVSSVVRDVVKRITTQGWQVQEHNLDISAARTAFETLRAAVLDYRYGEMMEERTDDLTKSFVWNVERGRSITSRKLIDAEEAREEVKRRFSHLFRNFDFLLMPAASVLPFFNADGDVTSINGQPLENIIDYLAVTYVVSLVGFPAISIPCGTSVGGLPVGLQIVAPPYHDTALLRFAWQLQEDLEFRHRWPPMVQI